MSIESKGYLATPADIGALTKAILAGQSAAEHGKGTYLKSLVAVTTEELGAPARAHAMKAPRLKAEGVVLQLTALEAVHKRFYEAVVAAASEHLPPGKSGRAKELNRRTNFARSAFSTVRGYIKAGNDVTALVAARVVKAALAVPRQVRAMTPKRLKTRVEKQAKDLVSTLIALGERDQRTAAAELETLMGQLTDQLAVITGVKPTAQWKALTKDLHARTQVLSREQAQAALS